MIWKFRYRKLGGHVHVRVFSSPAVEKAFAKSGDLVFREAEWPEFRALVERRPVPGALVIVEREDER